MKPEYIAYFAAFVSLISGFAVLWNARTGARTLKLKTDETYTQGLEKRIDGLEKLIDDKDSQIASLKGQIVALNEQNIMLLRQALGTK